MDDLHGYLGALTAILLFTSFIKIFTSLSILRYGIGLQGSGFSLVIVGVALALSMVVMSSVPGGDLPFRHLYQEKEGERIDAKEYEKVFRPFLSTHTDPEVRTKILSVVTANATTSSLVTAAQEVPFPAVVAGFVLTEIREACKIGLLFLIPFVVLDLLVMNIGMALGITQIPFALLSFPLKLLLFLSIDGWTLVTERLLRSYSL